MIPAVKIVAMHNTELYKIQGEGMNIPVFVNVSIKSLESFCFKMHLADSYLV